MNKLKLNYNPYTQMIKDMKKSERKTLKHMSIFTCIIIGVYLYIANNDMGRFIRVYLGFIVEMFEKDMNK